VNQARLIAALEEVIAALKDEPANDVPASPKSEPKKARRRPLPPPKTKPSALELAAARETMRRIGIRR
jgi:hypothetical protein